MSQTWPDISKAVGWEKQVVPWPTPAAVDEAVTAKNLYALLRWNRFLPFADTDEHSLVIHKVVSGMTIVRAALQI